MKVRTEVEPGRVVARAKVWPADRPEPSRWQAEAEDRSPTRVDAGTVGLWASGGGTVVYRNLRVVDHAGKVLLDEPLILPPGTPRAPGVPRRHAGHPARPGARPQPRRSRRGRR